MLEYYVPDHDAATFGVSRIIRRWTHAITGKAVCEEVVFYGEPAAQRPLRSCCSTRMISNKNGSADPSYWFSGAELSTCGPPTGPYGTMARTVTDVALLLEVVCRTSTGTWIQGNHVIFPHQHPTPVSSRGDISSLRIGVLREGFEMPGSCTEDDDVCEGSR
ncbi:hypothetical protein OS493_035179 [Desmophyllum pertusum]|uniref:Uncharacterized protein n=1 Tax=Desmophyllum pertusum TaxID=174260 RepID=A0A9W9Y7P3_9CNID|nr:hypothetical protein OS493_035179 [Desmophyllum pertusum]